MASSARVAVRSSARTNALRWNGWPSSSPKTSAVRRPRFIAVSVAIASCVSGTSRVTPPSGAEDLRAVVVGAPHVQPVVLHIDVRPLQSTQLAETKPCPQRHDDRSPAWVGRPDQPVGFFGVGHRSSSILSETRLRASISGTSSSSFHRFATPSILTENGELDPYRPRHRALLASAPRCGVGDSKLSGCIFLFRGRSLPRTNRALLWYREKAEHLAC